MGARRASSTTDRFLFFSTYKGQTLTPPTPEQCHSVTKDPLRLMASTRIDHRQSYHKEIAKGRAPGVGDRQKEEGLTERMQRPHRLRGGRQWVTARWVARG